MISRDYVGEVLNDESRSPTSSQSAGPVPPPPPSRFKPLDLQQLFALDIKPREMVLDPIIPEKGLVMIYAARGTGKTHVALGIAYAVATGTSFLRWQAERPRRVLLID